MTEPNWSDYPNFSRGEFVCKCGCDRADMQPEFMKKLQHLRTLHERPLRVTSGFRCPEYNQRVSTTGPNGPHTTGLAADISVAGAEAHSLLSLCMVKFTGVGVKQHGPHAGRFIHLDIIAPGATRPWLWTY